MDRASDSGSEGWGFESLPVYQKDQIPFGIWSFCFPEGLEQLNPTARWAVGRWVEAHRHHNVTSPFRCLKKSSGLRVSSIFATRPLPFSRRRRQSARSPFRCTPSEAWKKGGCEQENRHRVPSGKCQSGLLRSLREIATSASKMPSRDDSGSLSKYSHSLFLPAQILPPLFVYYCALLGAFSRATIEESL